MPTDAYKTLYDNQPSTGAAALYTVPGATSAIAKHITATNTDTSDRTIQWYRNGTTAAKKWGPPMVLKANGGFAEFDGTIGMASGDTIGADPSVSAKINVVINGDEIT